MKFTSIFYWTFFSLFLPAKASLLSLIGDAFGLRFQFDEDSLSNDLNRYIVTFKNKAGRRAGIRAAFNFLFDLDKINAIVVTLPNDCVEKLRNNPNIESIDEDELVTLISSVEDGLTRRLRQDAKGTERTAASRKKNNQRRLLAQQVPYGISMVQADQVAYGGNMKVCIIDTGYLLGHEDLPKENVDGFRPRGIFPNFRFFGRKSPGDWDDDSVSHGSHVAGTIAALDNDVGVVGVAPGVDLYIVNIFPRRGISTFSDIIRSIGFCEDAGAKVINMSFGSRTTKFRRRLDGGPYFRAVNQAYQNGILLVSSAGNDNTTSYKVPQAYDSVIAVGALDENEKIADFSDKNDKVDIAAPGVLVLSTVASGILSTLQVNLTSNNESDINSLAFDESLVGEAVGQLEFCGLGDGQVPCNPSGKICLIERGEISFAEKVKFCEDRNCSATIIQNNVPGPLLGTLGAFRSMAPAVSVATEDGEYLKNYTGEVRVLIEEDVYGYFSGTSMASPHVAGVAALVWSQHPSCTNVQIREALQLTAKDLGEPGKDNAYGHGLVQAKAALDYLNVNGCS